MQLSSTNPKRVLIDTNALIRYLGIDTGKLDGEKSLSGKANDIIKNGLVGHYPIFLPSISIIEIWANISESRESKKKFVQVVKQLYEEEYIRIVELSSQTVRAFTEIPNEPPIKEHDKIIFALAIEYECNIIVTSDNSIIEFCSYNTQLNVVSCS